MKAYRDTKDCDIEWIGKIPRHWIITKIKYCSYVKGRVGWQGLRFEEFIDHGPYLITGTDFENGKINWQKCYHVEEWRYDQDPYIQIQNSDLLITKDGTIGKVALVEKMPKPSTLNAGIMVIRPEKNIYLPKFMFWVLNSYMFNQYIEYTKRGSTIGHLYQETFENFVFALPENLREQEDIIEFIDNKIKKLDKYVNVRQKLIELLKEKRQVLLDQVMFKGLDVYANIKNSGIEWIGEVPIHWDVAKIKRYSSKIGSGITPRGGSEVYVNEGIPLIREQNVKFNGLDLEEVVYITPQMHDEMNDTKLREGDVLLNITGASLGRCSIVPSGFGEGNVNQHVSIIRPTGALNPKFLYYYLSTNPIQFFLYAIQVGASRQGLTFEDISNLHILIPPHEEQKEIVVYLNRIIDNINRIIKNIDTQIKKIEEYRTSLIFSAISGKIDVRKQVVMQ